MEVKFKKSVFSCLHTPLRETRNTEQTQELKLPDTMPDIGHILAAWGQPVLRSKEWNGDYAAFSGGMMVWVLYKPEDGSEEQCLETWIPIQMKWPLPEGAREGALRILCLPRQVDARTVSARKMMIRAGMGVLAEAFSPMECEYYPPDSDVEGLEQLRTAYPVRIPTEAGEKVFQIDEELTLPDSAPLPERILSYRMQPKLTDKKILGSKIVFRGNGNLHVLYRSEEGQLHSRDFALPFSQYAELSQEHGTDAAVDVMLTPTGVEAELDQEGHMHLKSSIASQFLIIDKQLIDVVEDVYSPGREVEMDTTELEIPAVLERRSENLYGEQNISAEGTRVVDVSFQPDFPRQMRREDGVELTFPGTFQVLYYDGDGALRSGTARWDGSAYLKADEHVRITGIPEMAELQASANGSQIQMKADFPVEIITTADQKIPMVSAARTGELLPVNPNRPTLILRRAGESRLWDIAKATGSTMEGIRRVNNLQNEPSPQQMLLIPIRG